MNTTLADALDILRTMKRTWTRSKWCQKDFARNLCGNGVMPDHRDAVSFCGQGIILRISGYQHKRGHGIIPLGAGIVAEQMLELKLAEMYETPEGYTLGSEKMIPYINDLEDETGYEKIVAAIDAILIEHAPKATQQIEVATLELQPA